jgi:hypothetical protein
MISRTKAELEETSTAANVIKDKFLEDYYSVKNGADVYHAKDKECAVLE